MKYFIAFTLIFTGAIHLLPIIGVLGHEHLARLYGVAFTDTNSLILMRHRAVLFGLFGVLLVYFGITPSHINLMLVVALISTISFIMLSYGQGSITTEIQRVMWIDLACAPLLLSALVMHLIFPVR